MNYIILPVSISFIGGPVSASFPLVARATSPHGAHICRALLSLSFAVMIFTVPFGLNWTSKMVIHHAARCGGRPFCQRNLYKWNVRFSLRSFGGVIRSTSAQLGHLCPLWIMSTSLSTSLSSVRRSSSHVRTRACLGVMPFIAPLRSIIKCHFLRERMKKKKIIYFFCASSALEAPEH